MAANSQTGHLIAKVRRAHILDGRNGGERSGRALNPKDEVRSQAGREKMTANSQTGHSIAKMSCAHKLDGRNDSEQSDRALNHALSCSQTGREEWRRTVRQGTQSQRRGALTAWKGGMMVNSQTGHSIAKMSCAHKLGGRNGGEWSDKALNAKMKRTHILEGRNGGEWSDWALNREDELGSQTAWEEGQQTVREGTQTQR
jgi:hypothetical protein